VIGREKLKFVNKKAQNWK